MTSPPASPLPAPESHRGDPLTLAHLWHWLGRDRISGDVLDWAPDVAALTTELLKRSQAFRLVVCPPPGEEWPPEGLSVVTAGAAAEWRSLMEAGPAGAPSLVRRLWATISEHLGTPIAELAEGRPWSLCEALFTVHAIADEASACGQSVPSSAAVAIHRARARELLVRHGSLSRLPTDRLVQVPKSRTTQAGMTHRSLSRYVSTTSGGIPTVWHRAPVRRLGSSAARHANIVLLPWPLRIRESDFRPEGPTRRPEREPFGFFTYTPSEPLDLDLVDQVLEVALDEVDGVDVVALPEGTLAESDVAGLEAVLARRQVPLLVGGLRVDPPGPGRMPGNAVHVGVRVGGQWWHYRQNKHHRWNLDVGQIEQYNLAGALHPSTRWWEAMEIPQRSVNVFELGEGLTVAAVVCEDLARQDGVADLLREIAPTLVLVLLLDGPQLGSRWTARYAGVLSDDPASAVLSLTAYGMTARSRPRGMPPSNVVAMWKDPVRGLREIPLEPGAHGVLIKTVSSGSSRYAADGRTPVDDCVDLHVVGVDQLHGSAVGRAGAPAPAHRDRPSPGLEPAMSSEPPLATEELGVLSSWAEAVAQTLLEEVRGPRTPDEPTAPMSSVGEHLRRVLAEAAPGAAWRLRLGMDDPSPQLARAIGELDRLSTAVSVDRPLTSAEDLLGAVRATPANDPVVGRLVHRLLRGAIDNLC